jgi:hypothetical protein
MPISSKESKQCQIDKFYPIPYQIISNGKFEFFRQFGSKSNNPFFLAVISHNLENF